MTSTRETVLAELHARLKHALRRTPFLECLRNEPLPVTIPENGLVIVRDGNPGEPEYSMSPLRWHYEHRAEVEVLTQFCDRAEQFDTICQTIGAALAADRTLGGLCEWVEPEAPQPSDLPVDGAETIKAAVIAVVLHYTTADPLG
jgi:hypothetical protein